MVLGLTSLIFLPLQGLLGAPDPDPEPEPPYAHGAYGYSPIQGDYDLGNLPVHGSGCGGGPCEDTEQEQALEIREEQGDSVLQQEMKWLRSEI